MVTNFLLVNFVANKQDQAGALLLAWTIEMLKNKILATNLVYINIFHDQRNILQYTKVLDKIFNDISKKNIKKKIISKVSFKPIKRIN